ncbi:MAG TPA: cupin domain-containing protein [Anaerolineales bacterium]|nr:cupin domain-containing protein [Anaerolineales bacterium]
MFYKSSDDHFQEVLKGISIKTLVVGEKTLLSEFHMEKGSQLPMHSHPQEQTGRLLKGRIILTIADEKAELNPGDCWIVPGNAMHCAEILEDSVAIEVFSPVREDYLQYFQK